VTSLSDDRVSDVRPRVIADLKAWNALSSSDALSVRHGRQATPRLLLNCVLLNCLQPGPTWNFWQRWESASACRVEPQSPGNILPHSPIADFVLRTAATLSESHFGAWPCLLAGQSEESEAVIVEPFLIWSFTIRSLSNR
jgi:hypothetical protein